MVTVEDYTCLRHDLDISQGSGPGPGVFLRHRARPSAPWSCLYPPPPKFSSWLSTRPRVSILCASFPPERCDAERGAACHPHHTPAHAMLLSSKFIRDLVRARPNKRRVTWIESGMLPPRLAARSVCSLILHISAARLCRCCVRRPPRQPSLRDCVLWWSRRTPARSLSTTMEAIPPPSLDNP